MSQRISILLLIVLPLVTGATGAAEFSDQRLFTRSDQREKLDRAREGMGVRKPDASDDRVIAVEEPPRVPEVRVQGYIQRSDGPPAVWVNERNTMGSGNVGSGVRVYDGSIRGQTVLIRLPDGRYLRLKPGQRYDPDSGRVRDALRE